MNLKAIQHNLVTAFWIGWYGFLEALRSRLLGGILLFVLPFTASVHFFDIYKVGLQVKLVKDIGMALASICGLVIVFFLAFWQIFPDIRGQTIYFILSRCRDRRWYILGRFLGIGAALAFFHAFVGVWLLLLLRLQTGVWFWEILIGSFTIFLKQCIVVSFILAAAAGATPIIALNLTILTYVMGHVLDIGRMLLNEQSSAVSALAWEILGVLIPDFSLFEIQTAIVHELPIGIKAIALLTGYSLSISLFYLSIGALLLNKRDL